MIDKVFRKIKSQYVKMTQKDINKKYDGLSEYNTDVPDAKYLNINENKISKKEKSLYKNAEKFIKAYHQKYGQEHEFTELTDDKLKEFFLGYMHCHEYDDVYGCRKKFVTDLLGYTINDYLGKFKWDDPDLKNNDNYKKYEYFCDISTRLSECIIFGEFDKCWIEYNGQKRTVSEAAALAADKWMDLLFEWHLNDNGALDEKTSFTASVLSSAIGNNAKKTISDDAKKKTHELLKGYYIALDNYDIEWCKKKIPSGDSKNFNWNSFANLSCDYDPSWPLYLVLLNAGVNKDDIRKICPWKTEISVRKVDNAVIIDTYGKSETL